MTMIQQIAAAIAKANGDDYGKISRDWNGEFYRIEMPAQTDYDAMAEAAVRALVEAISSSIVDDDNDLPTADDVRGILDTREQARLQPLGTDWMDKPK